MNNKKNEKLDVSKVVIQELTGEDPAKKKTKRPLWKVIQIPVLAIITGLIIGAIIIAVTSETVYAAFSTGFWNGLITAVKEIGTAYQSLFIGSIGDPSRIIAAIQSGNAETYL